MKSDAVLEALIVTDELGRRPVRAVDHEARADAFARLAGDLTGAPERLFEQVVERAQGLSGAASAGLSICETLDAARVFRWDAVAGASIARRGEVVPADEDPSSIVLQRADVQLLSRPATAFPVLGAAPAVREMLLVPLETEGAPVGTLWATHEDGSFDSGDVDLLRALAGFAAAGLSLRQGGAAPPGDDGRDAVERRQRALIDGIPQLVWCAGPQGDWTWASQQWTRYTGLGAAESLGDGWLGAVHPEDRETVRRAWAAAARDRRFNVECRVLNAAKRQYRWFQTRGAPVLDDDGELIEWLGTSTDVDELRRLQRHQQTLLQELQHRVRNTLAVVRSIAQRTASNSADVETLAAHFQGRLDAFSRVQAAVTRNPTAGVDLSALISDELLAHAVRDGEQIDMAGPDIYLNARPAETVGLAIHELATNAVKYGALAGREGRIDVHWRKERREDADWLVLDWVEQELSHEVEPPTRYGFGMEMFEKTLAYDLGAETELDFPSTGIRFRMSLPLGGVLAR